MKSTGNGRMPVFLIHSLSRCLDKLKLNAAFLGSVFESSKMFKGDSKSQGANPWHTLIQELSSYMGLIFLVFIGAGWVNEAALSLTNGGWFHIALVIFMQVLISVAPVSVLHILLNKDEYQDDMIGLVIIAAMYIPILAAGYLVLHQLIWYFPNQWWLVLGIGAAAIILGGTILKRRSAKRSSWSPLTNPELLERFKGLAADTGFDCRSIYTSFADEESNTIRVVASADGDMVVIGELALAELDQDELATIFCHELAHVVHKHWWKVMVAHALTAFFGYYVISLVLPPFLSVAGYASAAELSALPAVILVIQVVKRLAQLTLAAFQRSNERQADWYALNKARNPAAFKSGLSKISELVGAPMSDWTAILYGVHPAVSRRLAMADRWQRLYG